MGEVSNQIEFRNFQRGLYIFVEIIFDFWPQNTLGILANMCEHGRQQASVNRRRRRAAIKSDYGVTDIFGSYCAEYCRFVVVFAGSPSIGRGRVCRNVLRRALVERMEGKCAFATGKLNRYEM
jgi:hypothetical protein